MTAAVFSQTAAAVLAEAARWYGTPYQHQAALCGVGCDCLGLIRGVYAALYGSEPEQPPPYSPDWAEAGGIEAMRDAATRHLIAVPLTERQAGDVLRFRWRDHLPAKHAGILVAEARFIHAQEGAAVTYADLSPWWQRRIAFVFRFPDLAR